MTLQCIESGQVIANQEVGPHTLRMDLYAPKIAAVGLPGQFVMAAVSRDSSDPLLRRPLSIHLIDNDVVSLLYRVVGRGTRLLAAMRPKECLSLLGPLGRGFRLESAPCHCLVGGGLGVAPLLFAGREVRRRFPDEPLAVFMGGRNHLELLALADFQALTESVLVATDDGSQGCHGLVTDLLRKEMTGPAAIYTCGPPLMMKGVADLARERNWTCQVSLEATMACGMGACLGCSVQRAGVDETDRKYVHVCKDGPVFEAGEIWL